MTFADHDIPLYAILSHTWGPDGEEITYENLMDKNSSNLDKVKQKTSFKKLEFCADQAERDDLSYFWIDTCCIKKSSDAELSEAIRSMFEWYANAIECYVFLSDVPNPKDPTSTTESSFDSSRWFIRGWKLQELIAPKSITFFSRTGEPLGNKISKLQQLHKITGIATKALKQEPMDRFSVAERKSWAKKRKTTWGEDAAYCLLGIFGIHMPIMYGERRDSAMARLNKHIRQKARIMSSKDPM